ncbi:MAG: FAD-binding oxidoreductase [Caldilineaceae bacterium]|nr:FAD-binding oxidoreductase [Caldilineaceae bacterium]
MREQTTLADASFGMNGTVVDEFKAALRGQLLQPGGEGYDQARAVWNGMIDKRPALIARCAGAADVIQCVNFARTQDLVVSVRGGGHSFAGRSVCEGGLMIDLSPMKGIRVDPIRRTARAQPGVLLRELDHETQAFGLATTAGHVSDTGIAGLTLGGGQGWLMGRHGLTIDNLLSVDIVLADGRFLTASENENADLFWGVRGGGGNFGIVTSFKYRLHPVGPTVLGGMILYPLDQAKEVLRFYREFSMNTPEEMGVPAALLTTPDGIPAIAILVGWMGPLAEGEAHLKPLRQFGAPLADLIGPIPYCRLQMFLDAAVPAGMPRYLKMGYLPHMEDEFIEVLCNYMARCPSPYSAILFNVMKGAVTRVASDATAFPHRHPQWHYDFVAQWVDPAQQEVNIEWARALWQATQPFTQGAGINFLGADDGADRVRMAYGENYARLVALKQKYDPTNFFRLNANVAPANQFQHSPSVVE